MHARRNTSTAHDVSARAVRTSAAATAARVLRLEREAFSPYAPRNVRARLASVRRRPSTRPTGCCGARANVRVCIVWERVGFSGVGEPDRWERIDAVWRRRPSAAPASWRVCARPEHAVWCFTEPALPLPHSLRASDVQTECNEWVADVGVKEESMVLPESVARAEQPVWERLWSEYAGSRVQHRMRLTATASRIGNRFYGHRILRIIIFLQLGARVPIAAFQKFHFQ